MSAKADGVFMDDSQTQTLRKKILQMVAEFQQSRKREKFEPGKSYINYAGRVYDEEELVSLVDSSLDFWLTAGRRTEQFEAEFAKYMGTKYALLTNSGSSANLLALSSLTSKTLGNMRLKKGDEVITAAAGFPTTVNPIFQNGLVPVFLDNEIGTYNLDVSMLEDALSDKTRAIMAAHMLGNPFDLDKIMKFAKKHGLYVIEDTCDAVGATFDGKKVGTFGDTATVSFYPAHHMTMGEGGAVLTSNPLFKKLVESYRDWGRDCWCPAGRDNTCGKRFGWKLGDLPYGYDHKYIYSNIGYNLKVTDMQAAIGLAQLKKLDWFISKRKENFRFFENVLKEYDEFFILPKKHPKAEPSPFGFALTVREDAPFTRNEIVQFLESKKIATRMMFGGNLVKQPAYKGEKFRIVGQLKNADRIMNGTFWFGVYPGISKEMREYVADVIGEFVKKHANGC